MDQDQKLRDFLARKNIALGRVMHAAMVPTNTALKYSNASRAENLEVGGALLYATYQFLGYIPHPKELFCQSTDEESQRMLEVAIDKLLSNQKKPKTFFKSVKSDEIKMRLSSIIKRSTELEAQTRAQLIHKFHAFYEDKVTHIKHNGKKVPFSVDVIQAIVTE